MVEKEKVECEYCGSMITEKDFAECLNCGSQICIECEIKGLCQECWEMENEIEEEV